MSNLSRLRLIMLGFTGFGLALGLGSCGSGFSPGTTIEPGEVGLLLNLYGDKSVRGIRNARIYDGGKVIEGVGEQLYVFPTALKSYPFTQSKEEGKEKDQRLNITVGGTQVGLDLGVTFGWNTVVPDPSKPTISNLHLYLTKYNQAADVFIDTTLYQMTRDCATKAAVEGKMDPISVRKDPISLTNGIQTCLQKKLPELTIAGVSMLTTPSIPAAMVESIDNNYASIQAALAAKANAERAKAEGEATLATAKAAASVVIEAAKAEAESNRLLSASLTDRVLRSEEIEVRKIEAEKWDGVRPGTVVQSNSTQVSPTK